MPGYVTLGTNDLQRACEFYDQLMGSIGHKRIFDEDGFITWGLSLEHPGVAITRPFDGSDATVGNGVMVAMFYGVVAVLALADAGVGINVALAWFYVTLRIVHSLWQAKVNTLPVRITLFAQCPSAYGRHVI